MGNPGKRKGSQWETDVRQYLRKQELDAEALRQMGAMDEGDLVVRTPGRDLRVVVEAKNRGKLDLAQFLREAEDEAALHAHNRGLPQERAVPVAVVKARQKPVGEGYAVMRLRDLARLLGML